MKSKICIIVPVYNMKKYLECCVDSLLSQTFRDFTLLLVDDGSTDSSPGICDAYASKDDRVIVIHKVKNEGLGAARNTGLDWTIQNGGFEYVTFIDSDDFVLNNYLEVLYGLIESDNTEISMCGFAGVCDYKMLDQEAATDMSLAIAESPEKLWCRARVNCTVAWCKLYDVKLFEKIRFPEECICEDEFVTYRLLFKQKKVSYYPAALYGYFQSGDSITRKAWSCKKMMQPEAIRIQTERLIWGGGIMRRQNVMPESIFIIYGVTSRAQRQRIPSMPILLNSGLRLA